MRCRPTQPALPAGHPEAFIEAFANIYAECNRIQFALKLSVQEPTKLELDFAIDDGAVSHYLNPLLDPEVVSEMKQYK